MYKIYQVEYGDTIDLIATKTKTTPENIKNINGISSDNELVVGSLIIVPKVGENVFDTYKVVNGDNIYSIARRFNADVDTILLLNGLSKTDYIYPGQEVLIPLEGTAVYVTKDGDTIESIADELGVDSNTLSKENKRIFVIADQLIVHKKEENN